MEPPLTDAARPLGSRSRGHLRAAISWAILLAAVVLGLAAACANWSNVFAPDGKIFFVDADCYSRMTRVESVCRHPGKVIDQQDFENYPFGVRSHATAPLDYLIWALRAVLSRFTRGDARDLAGAWISPLLGSIAITVLGSWAARERLAAGWLILLVVAASPIVAHCFSLGRPDHQSLIFTCLAAALAAEWAQWIQPSRGWGLVSGAAWGLGLWTSLYEPAILFGLVFGLAIVLRPAGLWRRERLPGLVLGGAMLLGALALEGWRIEGIPGFGSEGGAPYFAAWSEQIGELNSVAPWAGALFRWTGLGLLAAPVLLILPRRDAGDGETTDPARQIARAHFVLVLVLWALTCWQVRWGYFLPLVYAMSLPWQLDALPSRWRPLALALVVLGLWPMVGEWWTRSHPDAAAIAAATEQSNDRALLRETADFIVRSAAEPALSSMRGILAPWWLCPALAYWSGQPAVAGSSHEALPGTVDTARFYLATDWREAADLLRDRRVRWIVAYEPQRVLEATAAPLLGRKAPARCVGRLLYDRPDLAPTFLRLALVNPYFKVFEVRSADLP